MTIDKEIVAQMQREGLGYRAINQRLKSQGVKSSERQVRKALQFLRDERRITRKHDRNEHRAETAIELLHEGVVAALEKHGGELGKVKRRGGKLHPNKPVAVVHLSDHHLNELIDLPANRFDFEVASQRLQLLADKTRIYARQAGCERIVIAFGGDLINSDRRMDEILSQATNRSRAMVLAAHLYRLFVTDLRAEFFVDCFGITGNEGRAKTELAWGDPAVSDSYDASIYWMLKTVMEAAAPDDRGLRFHELQGNEALFTVHGQTFLLLHGHQVNMGDQRRIQAIVGKHSVNSRTRVTHVIAGHIHSALVSDYCSRNSSLCGGNAYSDEGLNLASKASQNLHIVHSGKGKDALPPGLDSIKVDLQDTSHVEGYPIAKELAVHDAKSLRKAQQIRLNKSTKRVVVV